MPATSADVVMNVDPYFSDFSFVPVQKKNIKRQSLIYRIIHSFDLVSLYNCPYHIILSVFTLLIYHNCTKTLLLLFPFRTVSSTSQDPFFVFNKIS